MQVGTDRGGAGRLLHVADHRTSVHGRLRFHDHHLTSQLYGHGQCHQKVPGTHEHPCALAYILMPQSQLVRSTVYFNGIIFSTEQFVTVFSNFSET